LVRINLNWLFTDVSCSQNGLKAEFFNNAELKGGPVLERIDSVINFKWNGSAPGTGVEKENFSVSWSGYLKVPETDEYTLGVISTDGARLWINDKSTTVDTWYEHPLMQRTVTHKFEKGHLYKIRLDLYETNDTSSVLLGWQKDKNQLVERAVETAKNADLVLLTVGTSDRTEAEGIDRINMDLPDGQDELIERVTEVNKNTVVVLTNGSPVLMDKWINKVKGIVETWFLGSEQGNAAADVLLGSYNPSGKLPVTFPHKWEDCSAYPTYNNLMERSYYSDDIYVGYRHFDKYNIAPLFPFGYGLSYTAFEYTGLNVAQPDSSTCSVTFNIKNTGKVKGEETAQVYVFSYNRNIDRPVKELKGFLKVMLDAGEMKTVTIKLPKDSFAYYSERESVWKVDPGMYKVAVGGSSASLPLQSDIEIK
jgi:beta-glucosidase